MSVVCTKCGSLDVACEAMVNPNTKRITIYTDESFDYAWCNTCRNGVVITDVIQISIEFPVLIGNINLKTLLYHLLPYVM